MDSEFLTINEVSKYLKIPKSTIYKLSQRGKLPSKKIGKQLRFTKSSLYNWFSVAETKPSSKRILLVDDDKIVLKSISRFLTSRGYDLETAENAEEALKKAGKSDFDLLITDIRMPGINGIEAIKKIRELRNKNKKPHIPEIVITGYADPEIEKEAEKLKITDYIYKPFATGDFIKTIETKLNSK